MCVCQNQNTGIPNLGVAFTALFTGGFRSSHNFNSCWGPYKSPLKSPHPSVLSQLLFWEWSFALFPFKFWFHCKVNTNTVVGCKRWAQFPCNLLVPNLEEILLFWPLSQQTKLVNMDPWAWITSPSCRSHPWQWWCPCPRGAASRADGWVPIHQEKFSHPINQTDFPQSDTVRTPKSLQDTRQERSSGKAQICGLSLALVWKVLLVRVCHPIALVPENPL